MIEIVSRWDSGKVLYKAKNATDVGAALREAVASDADLRGAYLRGAYLSGADLSGAYLRGAYLRGADLSGAYLRGADLSGAYLRDAYLRGADLSGANLSGATGIVPELSNDLLLLLDQVGKIRAYKLVTADGYGPQYGGVRYEIGESVEVEGASTDPNVQCAAGVNVATLPWCLRNWRPGYRVLVVEFARKDIAAIPAGDGKFRLHRCKVVGEKKIDPVALGLVRADVTEQEAA